MLHQQRLRACCCKILTITCVIRYRSFPNTLRPIRHNVHATRRRRCPWCHETTAARPESIPGPRLLISDKSHVGTAELVELPDACFLHAVLWLHPMQHSIVDRHRDSKTTVSAGGLDVLESADWLLTA